ncbi:MULTISPECIES: hypothetical protein [Halobacteriovorax]|uniref:ABC transmembrane type-1 domain-containing protein n=1 Tax=Halobacteriovorax vibrionivorans TaxID=2152716 RepID=A0ABY0IHL4_9BACT|nr:hypothetical protein [Halobacteriovorax vibrionivorans]RZF21994.1 hypothetical protein DAY19_09930 [Halobacteriovorax vibrionivorans]
MYENFKKSMFNVVAQSLKDFKKDDQAKFRLKLGLIFAVLPFLSIIAGFILNWFLLKSAVIYITTFRKDLDYIIDDLILDYLQIGLVEVWPWVIFSFICLLIAGIILAQLMLRPFDEIADYCNEFLCAENKDATFDADFSSELRLLSNFSDWFFTTTETFRKSGVLTKIEVPNKYKKIHKPVFESMFFLNKSFYVAIVCILMGMIITIINFALFDAIIMVVNHILTDSKVFKDYLVNMAILQNDILYITIIVNIISYGIFLLYLYNKVATPAFGIFATMRSFISGRYASRVHLIGYKYVRNQTRVINRYLDYMEKEYSAKDD